MKNKTIINIKAVCDYFEISENVDENKSVKRLIEIRKMFEYQKRKRFDIAQKRGITSGMGNIVSMLDWDKWNDVKLKVTTMVINPKIL